MMKKQPSNEKALSYWQKIKDAVFGPCSLSKSLLNPEGYDKSRDRKLLILRHGTELVKSVTVKYTESSASIKGVIANKNDKCHLLLFHDGNICRCVVQLNKQEIFRCEQSVLAITYANRYRLYVAICQDKALRLLDESFELINVIPYSGTLNGIQYNAFTQEIVTYGKGCITVWLFRTAGTLLIPKKVVTEQFLLSDEITCICIEKTSSCNQRCFTSVGNSVLVHNLLTGDCVKKLSKIHHTDITQILYFQPLQLLVTSAKDGGIKIWNSTWNLDSMFVGHASEVTALSVFPYGPYMMSASLDGTLRTWSLDSKDEVSCENLGEPLIGLQCEFGEESFFSFSNKTLSTWRVHQLHSPFLVLGTKARLKTTTNSERPPIPYCICDDACVRIFCPVTANIVTTFISPGLTPILNAEYYEEKNLLFVLLADGKIVSASTKLNPCSVLQIWTCEETNAPALPSCISLYEFINKTTFNENKWEDILEKALLMSQLTTKNEGTLLIGGLKDGSLVVYDWWQKVKDGGGKVLFHLQAHREEITAMSANTRLSQLATTSLDKTLKIWRVFPFAAESLAPLIMFVHSSSVAQLTFIQQTLSVVYEDISKSSHVITIYKTKEIDQAKPIEHSVSDDHTDRIICVCSCPKLRLIASSSLDCDVKVWNENNKLIRVLQLNEVAHGITFSSQRGDLLLAIGTNIHFIHHKEYLPMSYIYQMVAMPFTEVETVLPIPIAEDIKFTASELSRINKSHSSYLKLMQFIDDIPLEEQEKRREEEAIKLKEFEVLKARDIELGLIKQGLLKSNRKRLSNKRLKDDAFSKYMDMFYNRPDISYPVDDDVQFDTEEKFAVKMDDSFKPGKNEGFFSINITKNNVEKIKESLRKQREEDLERRQTLRESNDDMPSKNVRSLSISTEIVEYKPKPKPTKHPLSASTTYTERLRAMKKLKMIEKKSDFQFTNEKLNVIEASSDQYPSAEEAKRKVNKKVVSRVEQSLYKHIPNHETLPVAPDGFLPNSIVVALYKELRRESKDEEEKVDMWAPQILTEEQLAQINKLAQGNVKDESPVPSPRSSAWSLPEIENGRSSILSFLQQSDSKEFSEDDIDIATPPLTPVEEQVEDVPLEKEPSIIKEVRIMQPKKPIEKLISRPKEVEKPKSPPKEPTPPPPPPPTPIPPFIGQFATSDWFQKSFPDASGKTFGRCSLADFVKMVLEHLTSSQEYMFKTQIIAALLLLNHQQGFNDELSDLIRNTVLNELNLYEGAPSSSRSAHELAFIRKSIQLLLQLKELSNMVVVELMVQFILAPGIFRKEITKTFEDLGLRDTKDFFANELYSAFDVSGVEKPQQRKKLHDLCFDWLSLRSKRFKQHILSLAGKIGRASAGNVVRGTAKPEQVKSILKKSRSKESKKKKAITMVSDTFVSDAAQHVTPIEAINYFCEIKFEEELERVRLELLKQQAKPPKEDKVERSRNTVLMLPKVGGLKSLARLGETHQSQCHPERETSLSRAFFLPPIENKHGVHSLLLHLKTLTLNPFPDELDELVYAPSGASDLVTLRSAQKYFIPAQSLVQPVP